MNLTMVALYSRSLEKQRAFIDIQGNGNIMSTNPCSSPNQILGTPVPRIPGIQICHRRFSQSMAPIPGELTSVRNRPSCSVQTPAMPLLNVLIVVWQLQYCHGSLRAWMKVDRRGDSSGESEGPGISSNQTGPFPGTSAIALPSYGASTFLWTVVRR